ncbi:MAG TPA: hypothetical protein VMV49_02285 [Candidatus Deferrimicrobium sp.]|nr:hypothetical protein [Candidatus Deferrimicrobium sp.]
MSENEEKKSKPKLRGWVGVKAGAEEVSGTLDNKLKKGLKKDEDKE